MTEQMYVIAVGYFLLGIAVARWIISNTEKN